MGFVSVIIGPGGQNARLLPRVCAAAQTWGVLTNQHGRIKRVIVDLTSRWALNPNDDAAHVPGLESARKHMWSPHPSARLNGVGPLTVRVVGSEWTGADGSVDSPRSAGGQSRP